MGIRQIENDHRGHDQYEVASPSGKTYHITYEGSGDQDPEYCALFACSCPGYKFRGTCKHIKAFFNSME